jgi:preprotein translocase subunit YajC
MIQSTLGFGSWEWLSPKALPMLVAMAQAQGAPSPLVQLLPIAFVMAIFFFLVILPVRRRQAKVQAFLEQLKAGDKVITSGGIYGTVIKMDDQVLRLEIADKVRIDVARNAIVGYQGQPPVADKQ